MISELKALEHSTLKVIVGKKAIFIFYIKHAHKYMVKCTYVRVN